MCTYFFYRSNLNPTDEYKDLQEVYQNCLELREYDLDPIYQNVTLESVIMLGEYAAKEGDKQSLHTYFTAAYDLQVECEELDIDPDDKYDLPDPFNLTEILAEKLEKMKLYDEAIVYYKKFQELDGECSFEVANLYLLVHRLDDALAYYHTGKVYNRLHMDRPN